MDTKETGNKRKLSLIQYTEYGIRRICRRKQGILFQKFLLVLNQHVSTRGFAPCCDEVNDDDDDDYDDDNDDDDEQ
jgi:hypothetical protein